MEKGNTVPGRMSSISEELEARKVTGSLGKPQLSAVAKQSEWELALGLQAVGALEPRSKGVTAQTGLLDGTLAASRGSANSEVRTPAEGQTIPEGQRWPGWELFETPDLADTVSIQCRHLGQRWWVVWRRGGL